MNKKEGVALPSNLRKILFSTVSADNIASINKKMSSENQTQLRILPGTLSTDVKLKHLPKWYTEVPPTNLTSVSIPESKQPGMIVKVSPPELIEDQDWPNDQNTTPWAMKC